MLAESDRLWLAYVRAADDLIAVVRFTGVIDHHHSSVNDEGLGEHPYAKAGLQFYSFHELSGSDETVRWAVLAARHWVVTFKDSTLDVVAQEGEVIAPTVVASSPLDALLSVLQHLPST